MKTVNKIAQFLVAALTVATVCTSISNQDGATAIAFMLIGVSVLKALKKYRYLICYISVDKEGVHQCSGQFEAYSLEDAFKQANAKYGKEWVVTFVYKE